MTYVSAQALLFDMDGVLINSIPAVERVWSRWAKDHGFNVQDVLHRAHGRPSIETLRYLLPDADHEAENRLVISIGQQVAQRFDTGASMGAMQHILNVEAVVLRPARPHPLHRGYGVDEHAVHVEQQGLCGNIGHRSMLADVTSQERESAGTDRHASPMRPHCGGLPRPADISSRCLRAIRDARADDATRRTF